jgi:protein TonB
MMSAVSAGHYETRYGRRGPGNLAGIAVAVAMHVAAVLLLLQYEPARRALTDVVPIMVSLITPVIEKTPEPPKPPPVKPAVRKPLEPAPVLAAAAEAPAPYAAPPPPAPEVIAPPAPVALPVVITPPNFNADYLRNPPPAYPYSARRQGQQGKVILRVLVNTAGLPSEVELRMRSGVPALDEAALEAVRKWRFVPARQGTQPVAAWVLVPIVFTLER